MYVNWLYCLSSTLPFKMFMSHFINCISAFFFWFGSAAHWRVFSFRRTHNVMLCPETHSCTLLVVFVNLTADLWFAFDCNLQLLQSLWSWLQQFTLCWSIYDSGIVYIQYFPLFCFNYLSDAHVSVPMCTLCHIPVFHIFLGGG